MGTRQCHHFVAGFEDSPGTGDDLLAGVGQGNPPRLTLDELYAQVLLQLLQLGGERGLAHEAALGRAAEVARVGDRDEIPEILQLDVGQAHVLDI